MQAGAERVQVEFDDVGGWGDGVGGEENVLAYLLVRHTLGKDIGTFIWAGLALTFARLEKGQ